MFREQFSLFTGSTGVGKTEILIELMRKSIEAKSDIKICFIVNKLDLLSQTKRRVEEALGGIVCMYSGKIKDLSKPIVVASIQSIHKVDIGFNLVILDEAHNVNQQEGMYHDFISRINPRTRVVACTATPFRADGYIYGKDKWFKNVCFQKGLLWSIANGFLVPPRCKRVKEKFDTSKLRIRMGDYDMSSLNELVSDTDKLVAQIEDALPQLEGRNTVIWACINIKHAEAVTTILEKAGENVSILHSKQEPEIAKDNKFMFEHGLNRHLVFVTIVSEGYDHKPIDAVVMMRPTRSPIMYVQVIGRGLRTYKGKSDCLILDYGGVIENCGPLHAPYINKDKKRNKKGVVDIKMKFCPKCYEYVELKVKICPSCEEPFSSFSANLKNLNTRAYTGAVISNTPLTVTKVWVGTHLSKKGNKCKKIIYEFNEIFFDRVQEFYQDWQLAKFYLRIVQLGLKGIKFTDELTAYKVNNINVEVYKDGNYWRLK